MITKAFVEEIVSPYQARVRIPIFDKLQNDPLATKKQDLNIATICTLPNCLMNVQTGDVVYVAFEDNSSDKVVILGNLSNAKDSSTYIDLTTRLLNVIDEVQLPKSTSIGELSSQEIACLTGITDNIQKQLNSLKEQQDILRNDINELISILKGGN